MSSGIDTRVVQIQFDNREFQRNVQQTIDSLERLNRTLEGRGSGKGLSNISDAVNSADFGRISSGVDAIKDRFSTLGIVGMTVIQRLTNAGIDMAVKIGGSIKKVGDQIAQGGFVRAQNLEQAKFLLEGLGADVEAVMKDVDWAVTGTAYGLDEAAKSAAIFYTSGVSEGDKMRTSLRAIAGAAAMTGRGFTDIADVFQDAAAKGSIMTMEIQRLQQQGVKADKYLLDFINDVVDGGKKTQDVADDVKQSVMDLTNGTKLSLEDLTEDRKGLLSKGAISFDIFAAAMDNAFGEHAQEANKTFSGSLANMQTALKRLGEAFITPGMQAAIPLFNSLQSIIKEFANDLIKTYNTVEFFTNTVNSASESIVGFINKVSEVGIINDLARITDSAIRIMAKAIGIMSESIQKAFPKATLENAAKLISRIRESISRFKTSGDSLDKFKESFERFLEIIKQIGGPLVKVFKTIGSIIKSQFGNSVEIILNLSDAFSRILGVALLAINGILKHLSKPIDYVMNAFVRLSDGINKGFSRGGAVKVMELFGKAIDKVAELIGKAFDKILQYVSLFTEGSKGILSNIHSVTDALGLVGVIFSGGFFIKAFKTFKGFFDDFGTGISDILESIASIPDKIGETIDSLTEALKTMQKQVSGKIIKDIATGVLLLAIALKILSTIDMAGLGRGLGAMTVLLGESIGALAILMKMLDSDKLMKNVKSLSKLQTVTTQLIKLGAALLIMAVALKILSTLDPQGLAIGLAALTGILGAVLGFVIALDKFGGKKMAGKFQGVTEGLMGLALALLVLSAAVKVLSSMNISELAKGLGSVIVLLGAIMGFIIGISKLAAGGTKGMVTAGIGMIAIATALNILAPALERMGSLDMPTIGKGLLAISGALIAMAGASMITSAVGAAGILAMTMAVAALALVIERIGSLDIKTIALGLGTLIAAIVSLAGVSLLLEAAIVPMLALSGAMLLISASIAILGAGLIMIGAGLASIAAGVMACAAVWQTAAMMMANTVQIMISAIINMLPQIAIALAESFVTFLEQIAELAPRFTEAATTIIHSLLEAVEKNLPDIVAAGIRLIINFLHGMEEAIPRIAGSVANIISGFLNALADKMPEIIDAGFNLVISFIEGLAQGIRDNKKRFAKAIEDLCMAGLEAFLAFFGIASPSRVMAEQGANLVEGLRQGIQGAGDIGGLLIKAVSSGLDKIKGEITKYAGKGKDLVAGIGKGIKDKAGDIKDKITDAVTKAKNKIADSGVVSKWKSAGRSLSEGVASGIRNGLSSVISATGAIADRALSHFRSKLKVNSPSKVFAAEAVCIPEGVALGINKGSRFVTKAVGKMSDEAVNAMSEAVSKSYDIFGDDNFNPTITPVLDLSQVRKDSEGLGSMFGTETVSLASSFNQSDIQNIQNNNLMNQLLMKMDRLLNTDTRSKPTNITNTFTVNGNDNPEEFVNTFIRTLDREMQMRAV